MPRKKPTQATSPSVPRAKGKTNGDKKDDEAFPLKLTQQQRHSLIHCTRIKKKIKDRFEASGDGTQTVTVTRKELEYLWEELATASVFVSHPDKKRLVTVLGKVTDLLDAADDKTAPEKRSSTIHKTPPADGKFVYQFKIILLDIRPLIWRRIQVVDGSLAELHMSIQGAFGWWDDHLHQFEIDGERYGPVFDDEFGFDLDYLDEAEFTLSQLIPKSRRKVRWVYEYDFGDGWMHSIEFEGFAADEPKVKYPRCVDGARACPPEDCGGPWGYFSYLEAISDPQHEEHETYLEWNGPFDPEAFDAKQATREMRKAIKHMFAEE